MKKSHKTLLYISVPLLCLVAVVVFNRLSDKDPMSNAPQILKNGSGDRPGNAPGGGSDGGSSRGRGKGPGMGKPLPVSVYVVVYESGENGLMRLGSLVANEHVELMSELTGRVTEVNFNEGQFIRKGTVLVKLNDDELRSQLISAEYQITLLEQRVQRQKVLLEKDAVSREDYDKVLTEFNVLKEDIEALKIRIGKMKIKAPFDGVIGFRQISLGAFLQPGSKIATLVDVAKLKLEFSIPEKYIASKLVGTKTTFTVEGINRTFQATIYAMDAQIDVATRTILLRALYTNSDGKLRPGVSARVTLQTASGNKYFYAPSQAVVPDVNGRYVWLKRGGKAIKTYVQTGNRTTDRIELLSGIELGDSIITTGIMQLKEEMPVYVTND